MVYTSLADFDLTWTELPALPRPTKVLLTPPTYFNVEYVINPHMAGHVGNVDPERARKQWEAMRGAYRSLGMEVSEIHAVKGLPDMVFCANQTLPCYRPSDGARAVVLSRMHAAQRRPEVEHYAAFFERIGYQIIQLPDSLETDFEGMGDAIWHPGRALLWGGYGFRTDQAAYTYISDRLDVPVLALRLDDPDFYHLDTCLCMLDEHSALIFPEAFQDEGLELIHHVFDRVIEAPEDEARTLFACNAHCPDGTHVLIQRGCATTADRLRAAGFEPVELATEEFLKSGGSVFCMKLMYW